MMTLRDSIEFVRRLEKELCLFNVGPDDPIDDRLVEFLDTQNVEIRTERTGSRRPAVAVLSDRDGVLERVRVSAIRAMLDGGHSPRAAVGVADAEHEPLLGHLKETTFTSYDKKQLLYASREIEDRARRVGGGTIHTGFQRVSVVRDQRGIYRDLASRGIEVHAYGVPDAPAPDLGSGRVHAVDGDEIADTWFVAFDGGGNAAQKSALIAEACGEDRFYGAWTYDAGIVDHLCAYLTATYRADTRSAAINDT
ncbi:MAG: DICT sensory domain-containing protein [Haloferacaceae archaeon]